MSSPWCGSRRLLVTKAARRQIELQKWPLHKFNRLVLIQLELARNSPCSYKNYWDDLSPAALKFVPELSTYQSSKIENHFQKIMPCSMNYMYGCIFLKRRIITRGNRINVDNLHQYVLGTITISIETNDLSKSIANDVTNGSKNTEADDYLLNSIKLQNCIDRLIKDTPQRLRDQLNAQQYQHILVK